MGGEADGRRCEWVERWMGGEADLWGGVIFFIYLIKRDM
jgi:hypothetical protein